MYGRENRIDVLTKASKVFRDTLYYVNFQRDLEPWDQKLVFESIATTTNEVETSTNN